MASEKTFSDWYFAFCETNNRTPSMMEVWNAARPAQAPAATATGGCGNAECEWHGPLSECSYVGTIGPCCPRCREIVEPDAPAAPSVGEPVANDKAVYLIYYDDRDRTPEIVVGEAGARARFKAISMRWNAHLFGKLESNSRDDRFANCNIATPPAAPAATEAPSHKLERGMRALMGRLASLLDEDQFKDCEDIMRQAGVAPAVTDINQIAGKFAAGRDEYGRVFFNGQDWDRFVEAIAAPTTAAAVGAIPEPSEQLYRRVVTYEGFGVTGVAFEPVATPAPAVGASVQPAPTKARDLSDGDMDAVVTAIKELNDGDLGFHGFCDRIIALATPVQPVLASLSERERFMRDELGWKPPLRVEVAVPGSLTDEQIDAAFLSTIEEYPGELSVTTLPALRYLVRAALASSTPTKGGEAS